MLCDLSIKSNVSHSAYYHKYQFETTLIKLYLKIDLFKLSEYKYWSLINSFMTEVPIIYIK